MKFIRAFMFGLSEGDNVTVVVNGAAHVFTSSTVQQDIEIVETVPTEAPTAAPTEAVTIAPAPIIDAVQEIAPVETTANPIGETPTAQ